MSPTVAIWTLLAFSAGSFTAGWVSAELRRVMRDK